MLLLLWYQAAMHSDNLAQVCLVKVAIAIVVVLAAIATTGSPAIADLMVVVVATAKLVEKRHYYSMCTFPKEL